MNKRQSNKPIRKKEQIQNSPDKKIDQDLEGHPGDSANNETINANTKTQRKVADIPNKDGEKRTPRRKVQIDEQDSNGSANAFDDK